MTEEHRHGQEVVQVLVFMFSSLGQGCFQFCAVCGANICTLISRDDAFSQGQAARLLLPTLSFSLHLQQIWCYPKGVVTHLTLTVLPTPKTYIDIFCFYSCT